MKLRLVKLEPQYRPQLEEMLAEWTNDADAPYAIRKNDYHDFDHYLAHLEVKAATERLVPDSTFFCLAEEENVFVGAVNIRHWLNEGLLRTGGHIGDGVRPSWRRRGVATQMIALALDECKKLGIHRVLMTCDKGNIGSEKSIQNNGGVLENEIEDHGTVVQRFWIDLK